MDTTIIKFNRPLLIATDNVGDELIYQHYYGFVFEWQFTLEELEDYVAYLCLLSAVSNADDTYQLYTQNDIREIIDKQGMVYSPVSKKMVEYGKRCIQKLGLTYDILRRSIDMDKLAQYTEDEFFITSQNFFCGL